MDEVFCQVPFLDPVSFCRVNSTGTGLLTVWKLEPINAQEHKCQVTHALGVNGAGEPKNSSAFL